MPIDYSLLQQQPVGRVVGTLPVMPNTANQFGEGLMQGLSQGAQIKEANTRTAMMQQQMDQSKQLFPSQLAKSQADASISQSQATIAGTQAKTAVQQWNDLQTIRAAREKSFQAGMEALMKLDPKSYLDMKNTEAEIQNNLSQAAEHMATAQSHIFEDYTNMSATGAQMAMTALQAPPGQEQQAWQQQLNMLNPSMAKMYPQTVTRGGLMGIVHNGMMATTQLEQQRIMANATPEDKNLIRIGFLKQKEAAYGLTQGEQSELKGLQETQQGKGLISSMSPEAQKRMFSLQDSIDQGKAMLEETGTMGSIMDRIPDGAMNPLVGPAYQKATVAGQELTKEIAKLPAMLFEQLHIPAAMMRSYQMQQQLNRMSVQSGMYKEAANFIRQDFRYVAAKKMHQDWLEQQTLAKDELSDDQFAKWMKNHPDPLNGVAEPSFGELYNKDPRFKALHLENQHAMDYNDINAIVRSVNANPQILKDPQAGANTVINAQPSPSAEQFQMPTFNNKQEYQDWFRKQPYQVQQQVRSHLGSK